MRRFIELPVKYEIITKILSGSTLQSNGKLSKSKYLTFPLQIYLIC